MSGVRFASRLRLKADDLQSSFKP